MELARSWDHTCSSVGLACRTGDDRLLLKLLQEDRPVDVQDNRGWRPLHEAAFHNHLFCLEKLLQHEATDKNWRTFEGETALYLACMRGNLEVLRKLLEYGADLNLLTHEGSSPLLAAAKCPSLRCTQLLLQRGANIHGQDWTGWSSLHEASRSGSLVVTRCLLQHGARVDVQDDNNITPIFTAAEFGHLEVLEQLLEEASKTSRSVIDLCARDGATPLMLAAQCGHLACVRLLLEKGADPDIRTVDGVMAIHLATQFDNLRCVEVLLNHMKPEALDQFKGDTSDNSVHSILHMATEWERLAIIDLLLSKDLNINIVASQAYFRKDADLLPFTLSPRFTPLSLAARNGNLEVMRKLIDAGGDVHLCSRNVRSPLTAAVHSGKIDAVKCLVESGAVRKCTSMANFHLCSCERAAFIAISQNNIPMLDLLLKSGVDLNFCWEEDPTKQTELVMLSLLTEENSRTQSDYAELFAVLLDHVTYNNYNKLLRRLTAHFKNDLDMVECLKKTLHTPHSLQHICRVAVHKLIPTNGCNPENILRQLFVPENVCSFVMFKS